MARTYKPIMNDPFIKTPTYGNIEHGDIVRVSGEYGMRFVFSAHVINRITGSEWLDCWELHRGQKAGLRSFKPDRVKPTKKRRKRGKRSSSAQGSS